jgi:hypothetical protein
LRMVDFPDSPAPGRGLVSEAPMPHRRQRHTEQQHLDLASLRHAILLQLVLNLLVSLLALLVLGAHTTTHLGGRCIVWSIKVCKRWRLPECGDLGGNAKKQLQDML